MSQQLYHIPPDALRPAGAKNSLVLFDELGATDLAGVHVRRYTQH